MSSLNDFAAMLGDIATGTMDFMADICAFFSLMEAICSDLINLLESGISFSAVAKTLWKLIGSAIDALLCRIARLVLAIDMWLDMSWAAFKAWLKTLSIKFSFTFGSNNLLAGCDNIHSVIGCPSCKF